MSSTCWMLPGFWECANAGSVPTRPIFLKALNGNRCCWCSRFSVTIWKKIGWMNGCNVERVNEGAKAGMAAAFFFLSCVPIGQEKANGKWWPINTYCWICWVRLYLIFVNELTTKPLMFNVLNCAIFCQKFTWTPNRDKRNPRLAATVSALTGIHLAGHQKTVRWECHWWADVVVRQQTTGQTLGRARKFWICKKLVMFILWKQP